jgi:hypothetical protein
MAISALKRPTMRRRWRCRAAKVWLPIVPRLRGVPAHAHYVKTRCQDRVLIRRLRILSSQQWSVSGTEGVSKGAFPDQEINPFSHGTLRYAPRRAAGRHGGATQDAYVGGFQGQIRVT